VSDPIQSIRDGLRRAFGSDTVALTPEQEYERLQQQRLLYQRAFTGATAFVAGLGLGGAVARVLFPSRTCAK
jgi:hypothetical protein